MLPPNSGFTWAIGLSLKIAERIRSSKIRPRGVVRAFERWLESFWDLLIFSRVSRNCQKSLRKVLPYKRYAKTCPKMWMMIATMQPFALSTCWSQNLKSGSEKQSVHLSIDVSKISTTEISQTFSTRISDPSIHRRDQNILHTIISKGITYFKQNI